MTKVEININTIRNSSISVIGIGRSGMAISKLGRYLGANIFISDINSSLTAQKNLSHLKNIGVEGELGEHSDKIYEADLIVISPGVAHDSNVVIESKKREIKIIGEIEFASLFTDSPIVGVTGSNGKSTTVNALVKMCQTEDLHGVLAGNIGLPFSEKVLEELQNPDPRRVYILEISSFQLEFIETFHPYISIFLNITPDHIDRHKSFNNYLTAKLRLAENQTDQDYIIYNADDQILVDTFCEYNVQKIAFSPNRSDNSIYSVKNSYIINKEYANLTKLDKLGLPGRHNVYNLLAAASGSHCLGVPDNIITEIMESFTGIPHRLEKITEINGIEFINDSKATNVDAVKVAIESFGKPIILILGGLAKGNDFAELLKYKSKIKNIIAYGDAREMINSELSQVFNVTSINLLKDAVKLSYQQAENGDIVLLSPGCASFDQFENFEDRGNKFMQWTKELI